VQLEITEARLKREMDQRQQELEKEEGARKRRNLRAQVQAANDYALSATALQAAVKRMLAIGAYISMQAAKAAAAYAAAARCLQGATRRLLAACMARARAEATVALQATLRRALVMRGYIELRTGIDTGVVVLQVFVRRMLAVAAYSEARAAYAASTCLQGATRRLLAACMARARAGATVALQATLRRALVMRGYIEQSAQISTGVVVLQGFVRRMLAVAAYSEARAAYTASTCLQGATRRLLAACMARARAEATVALQATLRRLLARQAYTVAYQEYLQTEGPMKAAREAEAARLLAETKEKRERMMRDESSYTVDRSQILDQLRSRRTSTVVQVSGA
jgi:hypothetical protein